MTIPSQKPPVDGEKPIPADDIGQTLYAKQHGLICGKCHCYSQVWINQNTKKWTCHRVFCQGQGGLEMEVSATPAALKKAEMGTPINYSRGASSNPHDHGMIVDASVEGVPGMASWRRRTNDEWCDLRDALETQLAALTAERGGLIAQQQEALAKWSTAITERDEARRALFVEEQNRNQLACLGQENAALQQQVETLKRENADASASLSEWMKAAQRRADLLANATRQNEELKGQLKEAHMLVAKYAP